MNPDELAEFRAEAETMKQLRPHVNVVQFLGYTTDPKLCIVTEFLDGNSMYSLLMKAGEISEHQVEVLCKGSAAGMWHLHSEGIVHRDLAARNVLLTRAGDCYTPKISDFGMSRKLEDDKEATEQSEGVVPLKWMSPEALREKKFSQKTDVWSYGIMLLEVVTRAEPYPKMTPVETALAVAGEQKLRPKAPRDCPPVIASVVRKCVRTNPDDRPAMKDILRTFTKAEDFEWERA
jgi:serine/threonine protein kinase